MHDAKPDGMNRNVSLLPTLVILAGLSACGHEAAAPKSGAIGSGPTARVTVTNHPPAPPPDPNASLSLSDDIRAQCDVHSGDAQRAPKFDFDDSALTEEDERELDQVAKCLTTGPLKGRSIKLVGRADPRGETEYNLSLGEHRAAAVREYLVRDGVAPGRITLTSRGALDATGTDEDSWRLDRRVDIALV